MLKILVTGCNGQLGSDIRIIAEGYPQYQFIFTDIAELDIANKEEVSNFFIKEKPSIVINCAAYTAVDKAETDQATALLINATAPQILAEVCKQNSAKFIHISTDYVFDGTNHEPYKETDKVNPTGYYAFSKLKGEEAVMTALEDAIIIRTSWLYSTTGHNFAKTMLRLASERDEIKVVFDQVGTPTYALDLAEAILTIIPSYLADSTKLSGIYHFSNEGVASWYDFTKAIMEITGSSCKITPIRSSEFPTPVKRPSYSVLTKEKIKTNFNIEIPYWRDSLKAAITKLTENNK